mmetsp:Transcript_105291/g.280352  ORF Transcript_105291/g.280352 Transcript_105291/m.280352 type:complete len:280 (+) Transcript_105291:141-980(+)
MGVRVVLHGIALLVGAGVLREGPPCGSGWIGPRRRRPGLGRLLALLRLLRLLEHLPHDGLDPRLLQDDLRAGPAGGAPVEHLVGELLREVGVGVGHGRRGAAADLLHQRDHVGRVEGHLQGAELVEDAPHGPDVRGPGVGLLLADLRAEVVGRPDLRLRAGRGGAEHPRDAEVAHLEVPAPGEEEVPALQVAVQDVLLVDVLQREERLRHPLQDLLLGDGLARLPRELDLRGQVPPLAVGHEDAEPAAVDEVLPVLHDEGVAEGGKQAALLHGILGLLR